MPFTPRAVTAAFCCPLRIIPHLTVSAALLGLVQLAPAQTGPQIAVSPGIISTVASRTSETLNAATFNGIAFKAPNTLYVSDSRVTSSNQYNANIYSIDLNSGQVSRFAGAVPDPVNGNAGYTGDGGPAVNAKLFKPAGLALDGAGNLYIADSGQNVIRKIDTNGIISTVAGNGNPILGAFAGDGGPALSAQLDFPTAITLNAAGDLYISDTLNSRVRMVSASTGIINTVAGNGTPTFAGDGGPAVNASLNGPFGLAVDSVNDLYIADRFNNVIRKVSGGTISTVAGQGGPQGGFTGDGPGTSVLLSSPYEIAVDRGSTLYISDSGNNRIRRLSTDGSRTLTTVAGNGSASYTGDGGPALTAGLYGPTNLTVATSGDVFFIDNAFRVARRITAAPAPAVFPLTAVGSTSITTITVSATGDQSLVVSQVNPPANFTVVGGSCGVLVPGGGVPFGLSPGRSCTLDLKFTPQAGGSTSGTLNIVSNAANSGTTSILLSMSNGLYFVPVSPCRVVDTRFPNGTFGGPFLAANETRNYAIRYSNTVGCATAPIPAGVNVQAYSLNVTVVPKGSLSYITVWPSSSTRPEVSTLNSYDGRTKANAIIVPANTGDDNRGISVFGTGDTELIIDINGYYVPESIQPSLAFYPLPPCRAVDTRETARTGGLGAPTMTAGESRSFPLQSSACNLPANAQAYALTFTAVPRSANLAYLTVWPTGPARPVVSTLNATTGAVSANAAIVPVGSNGSVSAFTTDATDLIIDVSGYYAPPGLGGLALYNVTPCRSFDTRVNLGGATVNGVYNVNVGGGCSVPANAQNLVLNATVIPAASLSYLTLWARGASQPLQSTLNAYDGAVTSNLAVVPTVDGYVSTYTTAPTGLLLDLFGYFAP